MADEDDFEAITRSLTGASEAAGPRASRLPGVLEAQDGAGGVSASPAVDDSRAARDESAQQELVEMGVTSTGAPVAVVVDSSSSRTGSGSADLLFSSMSRASAERADDDDEEEEEYSERRPVRVQSLCVSVGRVSSSPGASGGEDGKGGEDDGDAVERRPSIEAGQSIFTRIRRVYGRRMEKVVAAAGLDEVEDEDVCCLLPLLWRVLQVMGLAPLARPVLAVMYPVFIGVLLLLQCVRSMACSSVEDGGGVRAATMVLSAVAPLVAFGIGLVLVRRWRFVHMTVASQNLLREYFTEPDEDEQAERSMQEEVQRLRYVARVDQTSLRLFVLLLLAPLLFWQWEVIFKAERIHEVSCDADLNDALSPVVMSLLTIVIGVYQFGIPAAAWLCLFAAYELFAYQTFFITKNLAHKSRFVRFASAFRDYLRLAVPSKSADSIQSEDSTKRLDTGVVSDALVARIVDIRRAPTINPGAGLGSARPSILVMPSVGSNSSISFGLDGDVEASEPAAAAPPAAPDKRTFAMRHSRSQSCGVLVQTPASRDAKSSALPSLDESRETEPIHASRPRETHVNWVHRITILDVLHSFEELYRPSVLACAAGIVLTELVVAVMVIGEFAGSGFRDDLRLSVFVVPGIYMAQLIMLAAGVFRTFQTKYAMFERVDRFHLMAKRAVRQASREDRQTSSSDGLTRTRTSSSRSGRRLSKSHVLFGQYLVMTMQRGSTTLRSLLAVYRHVLFHALVVSTFMLALVGIRMVLGYPRCKSFAIDESSEPESDTSACSWTILLVSDIERFLFTSIAGVLPAVMAVLMCSVPRPRLHWWTVAGLSLIGSSLSLIIHRVEGGPTWYSRYPPYLMTLTVALYSAVALARQKRSLKFAKAFGTCCVIIFILAASFFVIHSNTRVTSSESGATERDRESLGLLLVIVPTFSFVLVSLVSRIMATLEDVEWAPHVYLFVAFTQVFVSVISRLILVNLEDIGAQAAVVVVFTLAEIGNRISAPFQRFLFWRIAARSRAKAFKKSTEFRVSPFHRHLLYSRMTIELIAILFGTVGSFVLKSYYRVSDKPSLGVVVLSLALQLLGEAVADVVSTYFDENYLHRKVLPLWEAHLPVYLQMLLVLGLATLSPFTRDLIIIARSADL